MPRVTVAVTTVLLGVVHRIFRANLQLELSTNARCKVVGEATTPSVLLELIRKFCPDVVVVDVDFPGLEGSDLIACIRSELPLVRIVISVQPDSNDIVTFDPSRLHRSTVPRLVELIEGPALARFPAVTISLPSEPESVPRSRRFVESWCAAWDATAIIDSAALVVSELVTNAITHGGGLDELRLHLTNDALRVEVVDAGNGSPEVMNALEDREGGRGLRIVTQVSRAWGIEGGENGSKVIWAELATV